MYIHVLGSSAGKPVPRQFCSCRVCEHARRHGGRDLRTRTTVNLYPLDSWHEQGEIKKPRYGVDLSPDLTYQLDRQSVDVSQLEHLFFTHAHADHCCGLYLSFRRTIRSAVQDLPLLNIYGNESVQKRMMNEIKDLEANRCQLHTIAPGDEFNAGELQVRALRSTHGGAAGCLHYLISDGRHRVLFAWDGFWDEEGWEFLRGQRIDALVMECVHLGPMEESMTGHLRAVDYVEIKRRLIEQGTLAPQAPTVALHIADNGGLLYDEAVELFSEDNVTVAYDGFVLALE